MLSLPTLQGGSSPEETTISGKIKFSFSRISESELQLSHGCCWTPLFSSPMVVGGYPILKRPSTGTGLELPLAYMSSLIRSQWAVQWGDQIFIKAFSSLLVATMVTGNLIIWHYLRSERENQRISYTDARLHSFKTQLPDGYSLRDLGRCRHIIGWCANAIELCGKLAPSRS